MAERDPLFAKTIGVNDEGGPLRPEQTADRDPNALYEDGRSSVMEVPNAPPHEHEVAIYLSYEIYAVCKRCGYHDWSTPTAGEDASLQDMVDYFKAKYPKHEVVSFDDGGES